MWCLFSCTHINIHTWIHSDGTQNSQLVTGCQNSAGTIYLQNPENLKRIKFKNLKNNEKLFSKFVMATVVGPSAANNIYTFVH